MAAQPLTVSVVIPVYNEERTFEELLRRVRAVPIDKEIIVVDDGSTDGTRDLLAHVASGDTKVLFHDRNRGKGAALRTGFAVATGDIVAIQDADLEYDPQDLPRVIQPIVDGIADVTFGSRFIGTPRRALFFWHQMLNNALTLFSNMLNDLNITDMETCYKAFRRDIIKAITIEENRFGIEPELTAKVAKMNLRIYEVPVSYHGRTYDEGKKIGWKDGVQALYCILRYAWFD